MIFTNSLRMAFGVMFIAAVSAVFAISFAAILYSGELSVYLSQGISLTLLGSAVIAVIGSFTLSYRGTIVQVQDVPAILLSGAAAAILARGQLAPENVFPTIAGLVFVTSITTGIIALVLGRLKLAYVARYIPYPVLAGFLATTGILLFLGGIGVAVGTTPDIHNFTTFFDAALLMKWLPALVASVAIVVSTRMIQGSLTLPVVLIVCAVGFYLYLFALGLSAQEARALGLLFGPFQSGSFLTNIDPNIVMFTNWGLVFSQIPTILTIVAISLVGTTLNASGLELELKRDLDTNSEMKGIGWGNLVGAFFGGMPGYHLLGETLLAYRLGMVSVLAGLSSAAGCIIVLVLGGDLLSILPVGIFAAVIMFLGLDLIYTWLWEERKRINRVDYAIVALIPIIALTMGFLMAIALGLIFAIGIFVIAYAKLNVIRLATSVSSRRSIVERPDDQLTILASSGHKARIFELTGYLFFGSANLVRDRINAELDTSRPDIAWIIMDFKNVSGMDISTWHVLQRVQTDCAAHGVEVLFSGLHRVPGWTQIKPDQGRIFQTLDLAIEHVEEALLDQEQATDQIDAANIITELSDLFSETEFKTYFSHLRVDANEVVINRLAMSKEMFFLLDGQLSVRIANQNAGTSVVAQIRSGAVFGELAYYTGLPRSADMVADKPSKLLVIDSAHLNELERSNPHLAAAFHKLIARSMARRLTRTTKLLSDIGV